MYYIQANDNFAWHAKERAPVKFKYSESNQWWGQFASEWIFLRISTVDSPPIFFSLLASYDRIVFCMGTFSPYLNQSLIKRFYDASPDEEPSKSSNSSFFVIWKLQTALSLPSSMPMGTEAPGPPMAECINIQQTCCSWGTEKCLANSFRKCEWVVHCLRAAQSKKGNVHKRLERLTLVSILHSIFDNEMTFDPNLESGILTRTLQEPIAGSPKGFRKRCLGKATNGTHSAALGSYFFALISIFIKT